MKLSRALRLTNQAAVAIIATDVLPLAAQLTPAILTTNTHFNQRHSAFAHWHCTQPADLAAPAAASRLREGLTLVSGDLEGARYRGLVPAEMDALRTLAASQNIPLLIATDGLSPLPAFVQAIVTDGTPLPQNIPTNVRRILISEQATLPENFDAVIIPEPAGSVTRRERTAGIVLAAGSSTRFGSPKQLLDYHGQPFIRQVTQTALNAGLTPVIVVTGANAETVEPIIRDLPAVTIRNSSWSNGQSTSIRAGIATLTGTNVGAALLLNVDQPQVTVHVIGALVERHAAEGAAITAPLAADRRTHPILFDRDTFPDLLSLNGDVSGRAIFSNYKVEYIPWHDESLLFDVDTADDYRKLLAWGVGE